MQVEGTDLPLYAMEIDPEQVGAFLDKFPLKIREEQGFEGLIAGQ